MSQKNRNKPAVLEFSFNWKTKETKYVNKLKIGVKYYYAMSNRIFKGFFFFFFFFFEGFKSEITLIPYT